MIEDPFAGADEAQAEPVADPTPEPEPEDAFEPPPVEEPAKKAPAKKAPAKKAAGSVSVDVKPTISGISVEAPITTTLKGGTTFDAPWIVLRANTVDEALDQVTGENAKKLAQLMERIQVAGQHFSKLGPKAPAGGGGGGRQSAPQAAKQAPDWAPPKPYEDFVYNTGVSKKTGKVWHAWMPPEKDDARDAKFFYPPR